MEYNRRKFLRRTGQLTGLTTLASLINPALAKAIEKVLKNTAHLTPSEIAQDETFWYQIRQAFTVSSTFINLNNGGVSPQPKVVQEAVEFYNRMSNENPTYFMWRLLKLELPAVKRKLSEIAGCGSDEIAIQRNATEALETIIFGLRLEKGDEVIASKQDYPNMIQSWQQREHRDGIVIKWVNLKLPCEDKNKLIRQYTNLFSDQTKVIHLTHMINWNGQIMPVKEIAAEAHQRGIEVIVDGAHSFAQIPYHIPDLGADYFGASLHKWLCAPFGTGILYVKKDKIKTLYPLFAAQDPESENIDKFESYGTRSQAIEVAIGHAIDFHHLIGTERKYERLLFLKNYWIDKVKHHQKVNIHCSQNPKFGGAIGLFSIQGKDHHQVQKIIHTDYRIHSITINVKEISGVRITPNVYTLTRELDTLVTAILTIADSE